MDDRFKISHDGIHRYFSSGDILTGVVDDHGDKQDPRIKGLNEMGLFFLWILHPLPKIIKYTIQKPL
jgi:hypothetical protein